MEVIRNEQRDTGVGRRKEDISPELGGGGRQGMNAFMNSQPLGLMMGIPLTFNMNTYQGVLWYDFSFLEKVPVFRSTNPDIV